jgi:glutaredoxin
MVIVRWLVGRIILLLNFIFTPRGVKRSSDAQAKVDQHAVKLKLYQFAACPFCVKVRRQMKRLSLNVELRDAKSEGQHKTDLTNLGGKHKVPCLRIENANGDIQWLYESSEINLYLTQQFGSN